MVKCSFCGTNIEIGTGKMLIRNIGSTLYFCSNKCEKNQLKLNRNPRDIKWTEASRESKVEVAKETETKTKKKKKEA